MKFSVKPWTPYPVCNFFELKIGKKKEHNMAKRIKSMQDVESTVEELGFLPFFSCGIPGFSLEERIDAKHWFTGFDGSWDAWDWKGQVLQNKELVYGKFFEKKAGFISLKLWPDFCNYRRDGYDFDARFDDGLASYKDKGVVDYLTGSGAMLTRNIKDGLDYLHRIIKHIKKVLAKMDEDEIKTLLKG